MANKIGFLADLLEVRGSQKVFFFFACQTAEKVKAEGGKQKMVSELPIRSERQSESLFFENLSDYRKSKSKRWQTKRAFWLTY